MSLVELLATVILIGIMGIALTAGIGTVQRTYGQVVRKANEQTLLHTTLIEMRDAIHKSVDYRVVKDAETNDVSCFKSKEGYWFAFRNNEKGIYIDYYYLVSDADGKTTLQKYGTESRPVVSNMNGEISGIHSVFDGFDDSKKGNGCFGIKNLRVIGKDNTGTNLMDGDNYVYFVKQITQ